MTPAPLSLITLQNAKSDMLGRISRVGASSENGTAERLSLRNMALIKRQTFLLWRKSELQRRLRSGTLGEHWPPRTNPGTQGFDWVGQALGGATDH